MYAMEQKAGAWKKPHKELFHLVNRKQGKAKVKAKAPIPAPPSPKPEPEHRILNLIQKRKKLQPHQRNKENR